MNDVPQKVSIVNRQYEELCKTVEELKASTELLIQSLVPVLFNGPSKEGAEPTLETAQLCVPLADALRTQTSYIRDVIDLLNQTRNRVEV